MNTKTKHRDDPELQKLLNRLSRIEGQVRGVSKMLTEEAYCTDVLTQVSAIQAALNAAFDLGVAYSTGSHGVDCDLIEAHKWFNLAAVAGHSEAQLCRADISDEMTAREIAEAQRRAREWLRAGARRAA